MSSLLRGLGLAGLVLFEVSCFRLKLVPPKTGITEGVIQVDSPEIYGRERLVRDRERQKGWLLEQLNVADAAFDAVQGAVATRTFSGTSFQLGVDATPQAALAARKAEDDADALDRQAEIAELQHQLQVAALKKEIEKAEAGTGSMENAAMSDTTAGGTTAGAAATPAASGTPAAASPAPSPSAFDGDFAGKLPSLSIEALSSAIKDSPINRLRDKLAYREIVRQELLENDLDDAHDIEGNTLYRMTFDTTVIPANDTSRWAVVEVQVAPRQECLRLIVSQYEAVYGDYERAKEALEEVNSEYRREKKNFEDATGDNWESTDSADKLRLEGLRASNSVAEASWKLDLALLDANISFSDYSELDTIRQKWLESFRTLLRREVAGLEKAYLSEIVPAEMMEMIDISDPQRKLLDDLRTGVISADESRERAGDLAARTVARFYRNRVGEIGLGKVVDFEKDQNVNSVSIRLSKPETLSLCKILHNLPQRIDPYAVTPKESVEKIADVAAFRTAEERALSAALQAGTVGLRTVLGILKIAESQRQMIRRPPLVVGYSLIDEDELPGMGWLLGPRFQARTTVSGYDFRHVPTQLPLATVVSVPAWWPAASMTVKTCWLTENQVDPDGIRIFENQHSLCGLESGRTVKVPLPGDVSAITNALFPRTRHPQPELYEMPRLMTEKPGRFAIAGENLWRSPTVLLGGQPATTVEILPDMKGLLVAFDKVQPPADWDGKTNVDVEVWVWTSEGHAKAGPARIFKNPEKKEESKENPKFKITPEATEIKVHNGLVRAGLKIEIEEKDGKPLVDKIFLEVNDAVPSASKSNGTSDCLNTGVSPWEITKSCRVELVIQSAIPGRSVTIVTFSKEKDAKVEHAPIVLKIF